jgi:small-conductance mechanosensitive channel
VRLTWWAEIAVLTATAASILGYRRLAGVLADGTVLSAVAGLGLWVTKHVLDGVLALMLQSWPLDRLHVVQRSRNQIERRARRIVSRILQLLWVVLVLEVFHVRGMVIEGLTSLLGRPLHLGELGFTLGDVGLLVFSIWASFMVARMVRAILEDEVLSRVHLARGVPYAISTFTSYAVLLLGIFLALVAAGLDVTRLTLIVGALGVGVGLGLQEIVKDLVAGAVLLFERPIQLGDVVQVDELTGDVRRIGLRSSTVRTYEGAEVIVPNSSLTSSRIVNWTLSDRARRVDLPVGVAYGTDPAQVIALLEGLARRHPDVMDDPEPRALFMGFGESSLDFQLRTWIHRVDEVARFRSELAIAVNTALNEAGISVPFPQRDVHVVSVTADVLGRAPKP